jgi:hypothetical protein
MRTSAAFRKSTIWCVDPSSHATVEEKSGSWPASSTDGSLRWSRTSDQSEGGEESGVSEPTLRISFSYFSSEAAISAVSSAALQHAVQFVASLLRQGTILIATAGRVILGNAVTEEV